MILLDYLQHLVYGWHQPARLYLWIKRNFSHVATFSAAYEKTRASWRNSTFYCACRKAAGSCTFSIIRFSTPASCCLTAPVSFLDADIKHIHIDPQTPRRCCSGLIRQLECLLLLIHTVCFSHEYTSYYSLNFSIFPCKSELFL